jgi:hypothetical protein
MKSWTDRYWLLWLVIAVGVAFGVPELMALWDENPTTDPLTRWIQDRGLAETASALGIWLALHFGTQKGETVDTRPAETRQAIVTSILGAGIIVYGAFRGGFDFESLQNPEVIGALTLLSGYVAALSTWWTARQQRAGELQSAPDGTVQ